MIATRLLEHWRVPERRATLTNVGVVVVLPIVWAMCIGYTWDAVRPHPSRVLSAVVSAIEVVVVVSPVSVLVGLRTYVYAGAYRRRPLTVLRAPIEAMLLPAAIVLLMMCAATAGTWGREPVRLVLGYIMVYVGMAAAAGLLLGILLTITGLLALRLGPLSRNTG